MITGNNLVKRLIHRNNATLYIRANKFTSSCDAAIPLFAFIGAPVESRFLATTVVTLVTLFTIGAMRATLTRVVWWPAWKC